MESGIQLFLVAYILAIIIIGVYSESWSRHNRYSYYTSTDRTNWHTARDECEDRNAKLAVITEQNEFDFLSGKVSQSFYWIGLREGETPCTCAGKTDSNQVCIACRESWTWYDGTDMELYNWHPARPWPDRACGVVRGGSQFDASNCDTGNYQYACQYDCSITECQITSCRFRNGQYRCNCENGYVGDKCDIDRDDCDPNPCEHGGLCSDFVNRYECDCNNRGYTGDNCETEIDECEPTPCKNGGACTDKVNSFECNCSNTGFKGDTCELAINYCEDNKCVNGDCINVNEQQRYRCDCMPGFNDTFCDNNINDCALSPCQNGGSCIDKVNDFQCQCAQGFNGTTCEMDIDECLFDPCKNDGTCTNSFGSYICICGQNFGGDNCESETQELTWLDKIDEGDLQKSFVASVVTFALSVIGVVIISIMYYKQGKALKRDEEPTLRKDTLENDYEVSTVGGAYANVGYDKQKGAIPSTSYN